MTQKEAVEETLEKSGGIATLETLYRKTFEIKDCKWNTKTPFESIRRIVQEDKSIYKIKPGLYALESHRKELEEAGYMVETEKNKNSDDIRQFNHAHYQGMLLSIGNMRNMRTFAPDQDKNRMYAGQKLGDIRSLQEIPNFSYPGTIRRISTVDTIWFNNRNMPDSLFEVEHSTDIQNSLLKFNDLRDFYARMVIVADECRYEEYRKKLNYSAFENLKNNRIFQRPSRVEFLRYSDLEKQYMQELGKLEYSFTI